MSIEEDRLTIERVEADGPWEVVHPPGPSLYASLYMRPHYGFGMPTASAEFIAAARNHWAAYVHLAEIASDHHQPDPETFGESCMCLRPWPCPEAVALAAIEEAP